MAAVAAGFFLAGVADGTVSASNAALWAAVLVVVLGVAAGSLWLKVAGHPALATAVAMLVGLPGLLAAVFFLVVLLSHPRWN